MYVASGYLFQVPQKYTENVRIDGKWDTAPLTFPWFIESISFNNTKKYLGVLTLTTTWDQCLGGDETLKLISIDAAWLRLDW